jgi:hypothetical protein
MIADLDGYFGPDRIAATLDELRQVYDQVLLQLPQKWLDSRSVIDGNKVSTRARSPSTGDLAASAAICRGRDRRRRRRPGPSLTAS